MTTADGAEHNPEPFQKITEDNYADRFAGSCEFSETRRGIMLHGTCPRCSDPMSYPLVDKTFRTPRPRGHQASLSKGGSVVQLLCTCREEHAHQPNDERGCGAYWNIVLEAKMP